MDKLVRVAKWADARTIYLDGSPMILPGLTKPLCTQFVAPTVRAEMDTRGNIALLATVDLPAGAPITLGQLGPWLG